MGNHSAPFFEHRDNFLNIFMLAVGCLVFNIYAVSEVCLGSNFWLIRTCSLDHGIALDTFSTTQLGAILNHTTSGAHDLRWARRGKKCTFV